MSRGERSICYFLSRYHATLQFRAKAFIKS